jgi:hypothetical protein
MFPGLELPKVENQRQGFKYLISEVILENITRKKSKTEEKEVKKGGLS